MTHEQIPEANPAAFTTWHDLCLMYVGHLQWSHAQAKVSWLAVEVMDGETTLVPPTERAFERGAFYSRAASRNRSPAGRRSGVPEQVRPIIEGALEERCGPDSSTGRL